METVKLSTIVLAVLPELYHMLKTEELEANVLLTNGLLSVDKEKAYEIIEMSILKAHDHEVLLN